MSCVQPCAPRTLSPLLPRSTCPRAHVPVRARVHACVLLFLYTRRLTGMLHVRTCIVYASA